MSSLRRPIFHLSSPSRRLTVPAFLPIRTGQGIEQQKLWLNIEESDLPLDEIFETVKKQLAEDAKTGNEPPLDSDHLA